VASVRGSWRRRPFRGTDDLLDAAVEHYGDAARPGEVSLADGVLDHGVGVVSG